MITPKRVIQTNKLIYRFIYMLTRKKTRLMYRLLSYSAQIYSGV